MSLIDRLTAPGPKRILTLDGGGVRGAITLGYLKRLETILAEQNNKPDFVLSDYFDLIGGTSTGSILASCISLGMKVDDIKVNYFNVINKIFGKKYSQWNVIPHKAAQKIVNVLFSKADYDSRPIEEALQMMFKDRTLGSSDFKSGLCIITKRADTNSTWPLLNHPHGKYFDSADGNNKDIPLWKAVRASAAAPTYFIPQVMHVGGGTSEAAFVDGGMTMANNPALQTLMVATLSGFPFKWKMGADNILLVSLGTGVKIYSKGYQEITAFQQFEWASQIPDMLMQDASWFNQIILQWLSNSPAAWTIDGEIGNLDGDTVTGDGKGVLSYLRYNTWLTKDYLDALMSKSYTMEAVDSFNEMDRSSNCEELFAISSAAAKKEMVPEHFPDTFKI
ncbi:MAG: patatin [Flavipsychrobacter sp.]|jgi:patatin-like phospholipase/acyl hydrolase|nr:patatin [Flavipsychrobacter sp.]